MTHMHPRAVWNRLSRELFLAFRYDATAVAREEEAKFKAFRASEEDALKRLNGIFRQDLGRDFDSASDSVHSLLWSFVSLDGPVRRILEIGTSEGEGTRTLARLFPQAEIVTVDLPEDDPNLRAFYKRDTEDRYRAYLERQAKNIAFPGVKALKVNSFFLPSSVDGAFDLIWVDGGHLYPEVAWDLCNAWNLCAPGGVIMCDDVIPDAKPQKNAYASTESYEVLNYLRQRTPLQLTLFLKRRDPKLYPPILKRKYVAYFKKPSA